jgi:hypothetical protein
MIVVLAIVGLLVVGGGVTGLIQATRDDKKHDSQTKQPTPTTQTGDGSSAPDFPTGGVSTDAPTDTATDLPTDGPTDTASGGGDGSSDQLTVAHNAETVVNALGNDKPTAFCPLVDPTDLKRLLTEKHLDTCSEIKLNSSSDKAEYREYAVEDPSAIEISGNTAEIPADAVTPVGVGSVTMRRDTDGKWKFRFYS